MLHSYGRLEYCRKWHNLQLDCHASYWAMSGRHASANGIQPWDLLDSNVLCSQHAGYVSRWCRRRFFKRSVCGVSYHCYSLSLNFTNLRTKYSCRSSSALNLSWISLALALAGEQCSLRMTFSDLVYDLFQTDFTHDQTKGPPKRKSHSPCPSSAGSAMVSSIALLIPCRNDQATAERCEGLPQPTGTA